MLVPLPTSLALLITPFTPDLLTSSKCLADTFYGIYGDQAIFKPDFDCLASSNALLSQGSIVPAAPDGATMVWLEQEAVDPKLLAQERPLEAGIGSFIAKQVRAMQPAVHPGDQVALTGIFGTYVDVLHQTATSALVEVDPVFALHLDSVLPRFWRARPLPLNSTPFVPTSTTAKDRVAEILAGIKFDPVVAGLVQSISVKQMRKDIAYLTGEDDKSEIVSRHSFASGSRVAAAWLKDRFEETGAKCHLKEFLSGFTPNVICKYAGTENTTETILLSAHYDSRGSFGSTRAPGGDDDGSGTMAILGIARAIKKAGVKFRSSVEIVAFGGEEQGLLGSRAYAKELREKNANLTLMVQADMLAYHAPGEPPQLGLPMYIGSTEVAEIVGNLSAIYSPEIEVGFTAACCSDHQSFHEQGFPGTQVFERAGPIADPMYHNSGDLSQRENYDFDQVKSIAKVQFATLLHAAGYELPA